MVRAERPENIVDGSEVMLRSDRRLHSDAHEHESAMSMDSTKNVFSKTTQLRQAAMNNERTRDIRKTALNTQEHSQSSLQRTKTTNSVM